VSHDDQSGQASGASPESAQVAGGYAASCSPRRWRAERGAVCSLRLGAKSGAVGARFRVPPFATYVGELHVVPFDHQFACHHSAQQRVTCTGCHSVGSLSERAMPMIFAISARRNPVTRSVGFTHERHGTLGCARCHATPGNRAVTATCASCHTSHHTPTADCARCHTTARVGHDRDSHAGCAGCHSDATVAALPSSRTVCLTCHQEQRTHYPLGDCATCHALADHGMMRAGRVVGTK
jgi:Class III cytochrome C family